MIDLNKFNQIHTLYSGSHDNPDRMCVMEAAAWIAGEPHTDHPECVCPALASYARIINDNIKDDTLRTELLRPLLPVLVGSKSTPEVEKKRMFFLVDRAIRVFVPLSLDSAGLHAEAQTLRSLPEVKDKESAAAARAADATHAADAIRAATHAADAAAADARAAADAADEVYKLAVDVLEQAAKIR